MAVVGEAHVIVRAITTQFEKDMRKGFGSVAGSMARSAGASASQSFMKGFNSNKDQGLFRRINDGLQGMGDKAASAAERFKSLVRAGYAVGPALSTVVAGLGSVIASLGTVAAAAAAAVPALFSIVNIFAGLGIGAKLFGFSLKGISGAVSAATKGNTGLKKSLEDIREEFQQLQFEAEAASLSEERAALNLEAARENLMRTADLPPNSAARREAELAYKEADLAYRRAKDRTKDLNEEVAKGPEALQDAASGGGADPYAGLTESQKIFAQYLVNEVMPAIKELREIVASRLLVPLIDDLRLLSNTYLPVLRTKLAALATTIEEELSVVIAKLIEPETVAEVETAFDGVNSTIGYMGEILAEALDGFLSLFNAAQPVAERFLEFITGKLTQFSDWSDTEAGQNKLGEIFQLAGDVAASFGRIAGNVITGIANLIGLNFGEGGAGWELLSWFEEATAGFANLGKDDPEGMSQYFSDVMSNTRSIFSSIGELIKGIFSIADNPAIGETFDTLKAGVPALIELIDKNVDAMPAFAEFITTIIEMANALTDTDQITTFWNTLTGIADVVTNFFTNDLVQRILNALGPIFGFTLALGSALKVGEFFGNAWGGILQKPAGAIKDFVIKGRQNMAMLTYNPNPLKAAFGRLGSFLLSSPVLIGIAALVAAFVYLYNTSDSFREFVDTTLKGALEGLGQSFGRIMEAVQPLIDIFTGQLLPTLMNALQPILEVIILLIAGLAEGLGQLLAGAIEFIVPIIVRLMEFLMPIIEIFSALIELVAEFAKALITGDWTKFGEIFRDVMRRVAQGLVNLFTSAANLIIDGINRLIRNFFSGFLGGGIADLIKQFSGGSINLRANPPQLSRIPQFTVPSFAKGGIVYPSSGGTLARVAEAGKPERIEPLDPSGLSARDRAMITQIVDSRGSGINITVNPSPGMDERELAAAVSRRLAFEIRKGAI